VQAPGLPPSRRALVATIIVEVISAMLLLCVRRSTEDADLILAETKTLLVRYLKPIADQTAVPAPTAGKSRRKPR
jgi:hypothetical protein